MTNRVPSTPLCGYTNQRSDIPRCRRIATHVVRNWIDDEFALGDLHVCGQHAKALVKLNPDDEIDPERLVA